MILPDWVSKYTRLSFSDYDCWQLVCKIYREQFEIQLPSYKLNYKGPRDSANIQRLIEGVRTCMWKEVDTPKIGNLVLFIIGGTPCHIGVCIDPKEQLMIHTMKEINTVIERYSLSRWRNRLDGFFRYAK
jgi:hypothetical protein